MIEVDEEIMEEAIMYASRYWNPGKRDVRLMQDAVRGYLMALADREIRESRRPRT